MIRFLNLKDQIIEGESTFAFYDTVSNEILSFDGNQTFDSLEEFKMCYKNITKDYIGINLQRYTDLIPEDFFNAT